MGLALLPTLACGSRTSALEQEAYDPDQDPYDSPFGGSSSGGSNNTPTAGSINVPSSGSSAGGSTSTSAAPRVCESYCAGYAAKCAVRLEGRDCFSTCVQEMTGFGARCEKLGLKALKCLTPYFKQPELSCDVAVNQALNNCAAPVEAFDDCKGIPDEPQPNPQPNPQPQPMPNPTPMPGFCGGTATSTGDYCYTAYTCPEGVYSTTCKWSMMNAYDCTCMYPSGAAQGFSLGGNYPPCDYASEVCGFTPAILK
jgi:hypothetical protein